MKKILVISWFYPPVNSSEGLVTYKLLNNSEFEYDVFTQKNCASWSYGNKDNLENGTNINCIFSSANNLKDWKKDAIEYFGKNRDKYDIVMTRSMPPESHEVGLQIKKIKPSIKWIASFGDPIDNNPYVLLERKGNPYRIDKTSSLKSIFNPIRILKSFIYRLKMLIKKICFNSKIEKQTLKKCDIVIFNSDEQRDYMLQEKRKNNIVIPHSYEKKLFPVEIKKASKKIRIAYIGHLDKVRTPYLLLRVIDKLKKEDSNLCDKLEIDFYGNMFSEDKLYIFNNELYDVIKYKKQISYLESLKIMKEVDFLLHIDANLGMVLDHNIFFAAKLADYIGSKTPIISITMLDGASANILREIGALVLTYSESDIENYLRKIIYDGYKFKLNESVCEKYNAENVAKEFDEMVRKLK